MSEYLFKLKETEIYLDFSTAQLWYRNQCYPMKLTRRPFACLQYLCENINARMTAHQIYDHIWGTESESEENKAVRNAISHINQYFRRTLAALGQEKSDIFECVRNDYGMGYTVGGFRIRRCDFENQNSAPVTSLSPVAGEIVQNTPFPEIAFDMRQVRTFASCGKEDTVFKLRQDSDGQQLHLTVNFEKTRIREEIPEYAGAYFLNHPPICAANARQICFQARSEDSSVETVWLELKPQGRAWMHESFCFPLTPEYKEYTADLKGISYPETLGCLEEVTFVLKPSSFANENDLSGKLDIGNLLIR